MHSSCVWPEKRRLPHWSTPVSTKTAFTAWRPSGFRAPPGSPDVLYFSWGNATELLLQQLATVCSQRLTSSSTGEAGSHNPAHSGWAQTFIPRHAPTRLLQWDRWGGPVSTRGAVATARAQQKRKAQETSRGEKRPRSKVPAGPVPGDEQGKRAPRPRPTKKRSRPPESSSGPADDGVVGAGVRASLLGVDEEDPPQR